MMKIRLIAVLFITSLLCSCQGQETEKNSYKINRLEIAENAKDIKGIGNIFGDKAILYTTELMPIKGNHGIVSIYDFVFSRNDVEEVTYKVDSSNIIEQLHYEYGRLTTKRVGQDNNIQPFTAVFEKQNNEFKILQISFGEEERLKKKLPAMLKPTGIYNIGQSTFFYDKIQSGNGRLLSFQVWYPTTADSDEKLPFRTREVVSGLASFLGFPTFSVSYFSEIESHTIANAPTVPNYTFPVLVYNHGYGGFTQVYQTVFEDLVSHGYIVVSIGHENESALLIKENGDVLSNTPDNPFYAKRAPELNGPEIGRWQSIILNSNRADENDKAYMEMLKLTPLHNESTRLWASDTKAAIEKLKQINEADEHLSGIFDFNKMGIFGHSLGGATAGQLCFGETIFKAGINLDGFQFGDLYGSQLESPFMFVSSNREGDRYLRTLSFAENSIYDCYQTVIRTFSHDNFTDLKYITEGDENAMELQRALVKGFFDKYLKNDTLELKDLEREFDRLSISLTEN